MKLRKLIALLTASFMLVSQLTALPVYAESGSTVGDSSADDSGNTDTGNDDNTDTGDGGNTDTGTGDDNTEDEENAFVSRYGPNAFDRLFEDEKISGFDTFIAD